MLFKKLQSAGWYFNENSLDLNDENSARNFLLSTDFCSQQFNGPLSAVEKNEKLETPCVVQLTNIRNLASSKIDTFTFHSYRNSPPLWRLTLSDGTTKSSFIIMDQTKLNSKDMIPGTKYLLKKEVKKIRNNFILNKDNFEVVGGVVQSLRDTWQKNLKLSNIKRKDYENDGAPKFVPFPLYNNNNKQNINEVSTLGNQSGNHEGKQKFQNTSQTISTKQQNNENFHKKQSNTPQQFTVNDHQRENNRNKYSKKNQQSNYKKSEKQDNKNEFHQKRQSQQQHSYSQNQQERSFDKGEYREQMTFNLNDYYKNEHQQHTQNNYNNKQQQHSQNNHWNQQQQQYSSNNFKNHRQQQQQYSNNNYKNHHQQQQQQYSNENYEKEFQQLSNYNDYQQQQQFNNRNEMKNNYSNDSRKYKENSNENKRGGKNSKGNFVGVVDTNQNISTTSLSKQSAKPATRPKETVIENNPVESYEEYRRRMGYVK
ncbi:hypothetical protein SNEBB_010859 [Seison nebaliae]|nr:hypothetical protein SNEBB_010859 [Seison nebaliae]